MLTTIILVAIAVASIALYIFMNRSYKYWTEKGVKQGKPVFPLGDNWGNMLGKQSFAEMIEMVYSYGAPNARYSGMYQCLTPMLVLRDPELIKQITVKDFDHFLDHVQFIPDNADPLWTGNLFALTGQTWKEMRSTLSPAFTSSKMKHMFNLISDSGKQFVQYFLKQDQDLIEMEMKDSFTRFTNDVIANTAFGVECDSLRDRNNEFYLRGKETVDLSGLWNSIKILIAFIMPSLFKILGLKLFSKKVSTFFIQVIKSNIASREKNGIVRPDMIHLLLEARKNGLKHDETPTLQDDGFATVQESDLVKSVTNKKREITDIDITSQALVFFFAGFDSVAALMCWMSYELAANPDIQARLIQEIDDTRDLCKGEITYEALLGMKYMDMVVSETLRKWPNAVAVDRVCTKPYTIQPKYPDEKPIHLNVGDVVWLPMIGIHRDPKYYPEPERFDPERFSEDNKHKIVPYSYIPFGAGPRNCIASRFALLETKLLFFYILSKFEIVPVAKTQIPAKICKQQFTMYAEGGFWFGLKKRIQS